MEFQIVVLMQKVVDARRPEICYAFRSLEEGDRGRYVVST
jgi:hypothetical protein